MIHTAVVSIFVPTLVRDDHIADVHEDPIIGKNMQEAIYGIFYYT